VPLSKSQIILLRLARGGFVVFFGDALFHILKLGLKGRVLGRYGP
jgi:hypothetical protein